MPIIVPVMIVVIVGLAVYGFYLSAKRRKELEGWARSRGLRFDPSKDSGMDCRYGSFKCLQQGSERYAYNVMTGKHAGLGVTAFDYHYTTGSGKNRSDHYFSAAIVRSGLPLKLLRIRPEGFLDKVGEFFGLDDIDFESAEFSRTFHVTSPDKRWAYAVIDQRMMEYLIAAPRFSLELAVMDVIAWRERRFRPADFDAAIGVIEGMLRRLPEYLVREIKEGS
ncbi:MAG: hypothetical protein V2A58_17910 [Planctomycetota bacterium]